MLKFKAVNSIFFSILLVNIFAIIYYNFPLYSILVLLAFWLAITMFGATNIQYNYFINALHCVPKTSRKQLAITFDDGPNKNTLKVLKLLKKYDAKATFFCIGHKIDRHPEIFKQIIAEGHTVGNHTYSHAKNIGFLSTKTIQREIESCNAAAKSIANIELKLFRPPFGITNPKIKRALQKTELQTIGWSIRSFDALFSSEELIYKNIVKRIKNGDVILLHDTKSHTISILERLLLFLEEENYEAITVDKLFKINAYQ